MDEFNIEITDETLKKMNLKKKEMGFENKSWNDWFEKLIENSSKKKSTNQVIEQVIQKSTYEKFYDEWITNFSINLENIWTGNSARKLKPSNNTQSPSSALVIGRGPSIKRNNHFELLKESNFHGALVCCDGALPNVLQAGITPERFKNFFVVTIDANESIRDFYKIPLVKKFGKKIKCILSTTVPQTTYEAVKESGMEIFWIHTLFDYDKGESSFNYIAGIMTRSKKHKKGLPAIQTGGNVGTSAWVISWSILKCTHIGLIGIDHGYSDDTPWEVITNYHKIPEEIDKDSEAFKKAYPTVYNPEFDCYCKQDPIFQLYSNALKEFIPKTPKWVKTINATEGGAIFGEGIECTSLRNFLNQYNF